MLRRILGGVDPNDQAPDQVEFWRQGWRMEFLVQRQVGWFQNFELLEVAVDNMTIDISCKSGNDDFMLNVHWH